MAERRMLSKKILQSRQFLTLSFEAQALYTHLILSSDDDGIVDAFPVVRMTGISDDALDILTNKNFILPLNDDMVYFIIDFEEQNKIRADRVQPSRYRDLLLEKTNLVIEGKRVTKPKKQNDRQVSDKCLTSDGQMTAYTQTSVNQVSAQYSIGKDSIGKDSIVKNNIEKDDEEEKISNVSKMYPKEKSLSQIIKSSSVKINDRQIQQIQEYIGLDNMTVEMIDYAIQLTEDAGAESFNYLNKILKSWKDKSLTSLDEAKQETSGFRESKNSASKTRIVGNTIEHEYQGELPF